MMLLDATVLSADLAKVSVGLASAAYKESVIKAAFPRWGIICWVVRHLFMTEHHCMKTVILQVTQLVIRKSKGIMYILLL